MNRKYYATNHRTREIQLTRYRPEEEEEEEGHVAIILPHLSHSSSPLCGIVVKQMLLTPLFRLSAHFLVSSNTYIISHLLTINLFPYLQSIIIHLLYL